MKILFIGDIFGEPGIQIVEKYLPLLIKKYKIDFVIAQGENVSNRKGLVKKDYSRLKEAGINAFTMGNHVFAKKQIFSYINKVDDIIRPLNVGTKYGIGSGVFVIKGKTLRITSLLGQTFMKLYEPWLQSEPDSFFDAIDDVLDINKADYHFIDFHAETTSEKNVFGLYLDGKVDVFVGTHTHVQTNDEHILPQGTIYISDVGMTGPSNCAIGANYREVYQRMRFDDYVRFQVGKTTPQFNAVVIDLSKQTKGIIKINFLDKKNKMFLQQ